MQAGMWMVKMVTPFLVMIRPTKTSKSSQKRSMNFPRAFIVGSIPTEVKEYFFASYGLQFPY